MDLDRYLARIGLDARPAMDAAGLARLQSAQRMTIGFENLDIPLGRGIRIDSESVFDKLVLRGRGGYCFEQNRLYSDALSALGVANRPLLARVRLAVPEGVTPPRTHVCLLAEVAGTLLLADAGFGGSNVPPLLLEDGAEAGTADGARHRLRRIGESGTTGGQWLLERAGPPEATDGRAAPHADWQAQYTFDLSDVAPDDLEQANHWTATRPDTRFTSLHIASIPQPEGFASMVDRELTVHHAGGTDRRMIADSADYARTLRDVFRIALEEKEVTGLALFA
ncbi:arylamine N-acetyltransferase family protein [Novosphingobium mangrovi (ex Huang et al. 2023)]|uniref:Arylamine N-acetyltransferase n=1 Tax=Novosphingobium mangrovi (ex Huang et al. 2023) TaxID=2976432 RepID=A0ABT2I3Y3_9SPHN|nr:arylamine N-acetyltransferase [Novosphingobium mangrovi (ex Huang et al. 2023)]MCT2399343.1 arylamine N-acetyltransferase [Novosphingobium mangrovi (ex Huang et al. 2023)]